MSTQNAVVSFLLNQMADSDVTHGLRIEAAKTLISMGLPDTENTDERNIDPDHFDEILSLTIPDWGVNLHQLLINHGYEQGIDVSESTNPTVFINLFMDWAKD